MTMNEEILIRMGLDASALKRGTMTMLDQQKKAAMDYVAFWKKAINEREQAEAAQFQKQKDRWRQELNAQRQRSGARGSQGLAGELGRNVTGTGQRTAGGHGGGGISGSSYSEMGVLARELAAGNMGGFARSLSVLAQRMGVLGRVAASVINPITGVAAGLAGGAAAVYAIGQGAYNTMRGARSIGFSTQGYQGLQRQSSLFGENEAMMAGVGHLSGMIGSAKLGDVGAVERFRRRGIEISGRTNEEIYQQALDKVADTADPVRKAALALELFGQNIEKIERTIQQRSEGFQGSRLFTLNSGQLSTLANTGENIGGFWRGAKRLGGMIWNGMKGAYADYSQIVNPGARELADATMRGEAIDAKIRNFQNSGVIKTHTVREAGYRRMMAQQNPELDLQLSQADYAQRSAQAALDDRGKVDQSSMADMARQMTGHIRPRLYTVTDRMKTAMKIDDLEAMAQNAFMSGDDEGMKKYRSEADEMRASNPWMKFSDRNPTEAMTVELQKANKTLEVVEKAANLIINPIQ